VISEPHGSWLGALEAAARAVRLDKADVMVVVCLSALETRDRASSLLPGGAPGPNAAFAFLLTNDIRAGGMGARFSLELGPAEHPRDARPEDVYLRSLVELLDCRARGAIAVATESLVGRIVVG
jgi:hypothetical protein